MRRSVRNQNDNFDSIVTPFELVEAIVQATAHSLGLVAASRRNRLVDELLSLDDIVRERVYLSHVGLFLRWMIAIVDYAHLQVALLRCSNLGSNTFYVLEGFIY